MVGNHGGDFFARLRRAGNAGENLPLPSPSEIIMVGKLLWEIWEFPTIHGGDFMPKQHCLLVIPVTNTHFLHHAQ